MNISKSIENSQEAGESIEIGAKIIYFISGFMILLVILAYITLSRFDINYLTPFLLAGIITIVKFNRNKQLSILLLVFPSLITINVINGFDLDGSFWLVAPPVILHILFICFFYYGCFKVIEGVFANHHNQ